MAQYLKPDSELGYVEDNAKIGYLKFNNLRHSILGCMLGDFNEVGDYVVSSEIVKELIAMEKYIVQTYDNIELCKGVLKLDKQITFMVTFEGNRATLSLVEKVNYEANFTINSGTYSNINEYVLDAVETSGEIDRNVIYSKWNISPFGGNVVDIFNCDDSVLEKYLGIVNRFKYVLEANKILLDKEEELEEIESGYANDLFEILKKYPKIEVQVKSTIERTLKEKKDSVSIKKPFFAKTFNELLENAIEQNLSSLDENQKQEFEKEKRKAVLDLNIKREDAIEIKHATSYAGHLNETNPKILSLKVSESNNYKTVAELGEEFVSSNKSVYERVEKNKPELNGKRKRDRLVSNLFAWGISDAVEANVESSKNNDIQENQKTETKSVSPVVNKSKKPEVAKSSDKKSDKKADKGGKKTEKKKDKGADKPKNKTEDKSSNIKQSTDVPSVRLFTKFAESAKVENDKVEKGTTQQGDNGRKGQIVNATLLGIVKDAHKVSSEHNIAEVDNKTNLGKVAVQTNTKKQEVGAVIVEGKIQQVKKIASVENGYVNIRETVSVETNEDEITIT